MSTEHHRWRLDADVWADLYITGPMTPLAAERLIEYLALITTPDMTVEAGVTEEALADFGLVFGAAREVGFGVVERYAIANDGRLYTVRTQRVDGIIVKVRWFTQPDTEFGAEGECATESDAIAAARAHDEQRRGAK